MRCLIEWIVLLLPCFISSKVFSFSSFKKHPKVAQKNHEWTNGQSELESRCLVHINQNRILGNLTNIINI